MLAWNDLSDDELVRGLELLITIDDLKHRDVAIKVLEELSFTPEDVKRQIESGEYLNDTGLYLGD